MTLTAKKMLDRDVMPCRNGGNVGFQPGSHGRICLMTLRVPFGNPPSAGNPLAKRTRICTTRQCSA